MAAGSLANLGESEHGYGFFNDVKKGQISCFHSIKKLDCFVGNFLFKLSLSLDLTNHQILFLNYNDSYNSIIL